MVNRASLRLNFGCFGLYKRRAAILARARKGLTAEASSLKPQAFFRGIHRRDAENAERRIETRRATESHGGRVRITEPQTSNLEPQTSILKPQAPSPKLQAPSCLESAVASCVSPVRGRLRITRPSRPEPPIHSSREPGRHAPARLSPTQASPA